MRLGSGFRVQGQGSGFRVQGLVRVRSRRQGVVTMRGEGGVRGNSLCESIPEVVKALEHFDCCVIQGCVDLGFRV